MAAITQDTLNKNDADYAAAYAEPDHQAPHQSDDDAFGLTLPASAVAAEEASESPKKEAAEEASGTDLDGNGDQRPESRGEKDPMSESVTRQSEGGDASNSAADNPDASGTADPAGTPEVAIVVATPDAKGGDMPKGDAPGATDPAKGDGKDEQRMKSWEGRLKAEEARLKALAAQLDAKGVKPGQDPAEASEPAEPGEAGEPAPVSNAAEEGADALEGVAADAKDPKLQQAADEMSDKVESGEMTPEDAFKQLSEDFGEPFMKMLEKVVSSMTGKAVGSAVDSKIADVSKQVSEVIDHISNESQRAHFETIAAAHPDFAEIDADPAFDAFVAAKGPEAEQTRASGSAKAINALLDEFKAQKGDQGAAQHEQVGSAAEHPSAAKAPTETASASEDEIDAAAGVRGGGMQLPKEPSSNDDFASAWNDAPDTTPKKHG